MLLRGEKLLENSQQQVNTLNPELLSMDNALLAINKMQQAKSLLDHVSESWLLHLNLTSANFRITTDNAYLQTLDKLLLPQIRHALEEQLLDK